MTFNNRTSTLDDPTDTTFAPDTGQESHPLAEAGKDATESAGHLAERAADIGLQQADRGRETAASGIDQVAQSIRRVSTDMLSEQPGIANAAMTAADQAERVAQYLRQTDARQIISKVEDVARRQPLVFLGGAFLLGAAASRFIKAAGGDKTSQGGQSRQGEFRSGYSPDYSTGGTSDYRTSDAYQPTGPGASAGNAGF
ncbi:MAG: hypothetical protein M3406_17215 [Chloroflexota bacterium]|nr:hypothetical protein [Chloroflexota bacterium]